MDLLILCCLGGSPFLAFDSAPSAPFAHQFDPTDWVATDLAGSLLNASLHSPLLAANPLLRQLIPADLRVPLEQCDLWNLTFASGADEHVFRRSGGRLKCRCPPESSGPACHIPSEPSASAPHPPKMALLAANSSAVAAGLSRHENSFAVYLLIFLLLAAIMLALYAMLRGCCFCDCFGGFPSGGRRSFDDKPLDPQTVNRCLEAVRAHEQNEKNRWSQSRSPPCSASAPLWVDSRRPLIPSVSECVQQQQPLPGVVVPPPRACSPPPSYRSLNASVEQLHNAEHTKM